MVVCDIQSPILHLRSPIVHMNTDMSICEILWSPMWHCDHCQGQAKTNICDHQCPCICQHMCKRGIIIPTFTICLKIITVIWGFKWTILCHLSTKDFSINKKLVLTEQMALAMEFCLIMYLKKKGDTNIYIISSISHYSILIKHKSQITTLYNT